MRKIYLMAFSLVMMMTVMACANSNNNNTSASAASAQSDVVETQQSENNVDAVSDSVADEKGEQGLSEESSSTGKGKLKVMDFYATWCGPCKAMAPAMEEMEKKYVGKIEFQKIDVDQEPDLANKYNISGVPTIIVLSPEGKILDSMVGAQTADELDKMFSALL